MSHTTSSSTNRPYGVVRVCQEWGLSRSTFYAQPGRRVSPPHELARRGPKTLYPDEALTAHIRQVLATSPFLGEGHRKVWARLRAQRIRTSKSRVLRFMRQAGLLAPSRAPRVVGPRVHDGTITTERPNQMWGTDATSTVTVEDGAATVFIGVDHCTLDTKGSGVIYQVHAIRDKPSHSLPSIRSKYATICSAAFPSHSGGIVPFPQLSSQHARDTRRVRLSGSSGLSCWSV